MRGFLLNSDYMPEDINQLQDEIIEEFEGFDD